MDLRHLFYNVYLLLFFFIFYSPAIAQDQPTFKELEETAQATIKTLQEKFPELSDTYVAIIGGLGVWHHLPKGRQTKVRRYYIYVVEISHSNMIVIGR